jgi:hypothetical protein
MVRPFVQQNGSERDTPSGGPIGSGNRLAGCG